MGVYLYYGKNHWKDIWNKREDFFDKIGFDDDKQVFLELKRINGFDIANNGIPYESFMRQYCNTKAALGLQGG